MADRKVFYPVKDVTICGILNDAHVTLCGFSDVWAYREYITVQSGFVLAAKILLMSAIKELELRGGITLYAEDVAVVATKNVKDLSAGLMLAAILTTAMRKTIELQGGLSISHDVQYSAQRWISALMSELMLGGEIKSTFMARTFEAQDGIQILHRFGDLTKTIEMRCQDLALEIGAEIGIDIQKPMPSISTGVTLGAVVNAVARKFREVGDLDGVSYADVQDWTLRTFYYVEV